MTTSTLPRRTALFESHKRLGGRIVDFHGWELPVQYESIMKEHDVSRPDFCEHRVGDGSACPSTPVLRVE